MSYKTNPIFNRLKIIKGWKNPYLPTKTLNYTRDISLWFKVYLLLKLFLNLKKIQLLSCEVRFEQQNKKILYLVINKKKNKQKKKRKKKRIFLKKKITPIRKRINSNAKFFFYKNLFFLKQISFWNQNVIQKKILSKFWLTKPKTSNWMNSFEKVMHVRQNFKKTLRFSKKNQRFIPAQHLKLKFSRNKQKQILTQQLKIKKINNIFLAQIFALSQQKKSQLLKKTILNLKEKVAQNQLAIQKMKKIYTFLFHVNKNVQKKKIKRVFYKKTTFHKIQQQKGILLRKTLRSKFLSLNRFRFLKTERPTVLFKLKKNVFQKVSSKKIQFIKKDVFFKELIALNFLIAQLQNKSFSKKNYSLISNKTFQFEKKNGLITENYWKNVFFKKVLKSKFRKIVKKKQFRLFFLKMQLWSLLKRKKKKTRKKVLKIFRKNFKFSLKKQSFQKQIFGQKKIKLKVWKQIKKKSLFLKKNQVLKNYQYRISTKRNSMNYLQFHAKIRLKFLIQDFVQKYFSLSVETKIIHFLNEHKNNNYFRLVFPVRKKKIKNLIKKFRQKNWKQKQIFLTNKFQFLTGKIKNQKVQKKKFLSKISFLRKKDFSVLSRKKTKNARIKNSFKRFKNNKDFRHSFKYFIPTLIHFSRTLEPTFFVSLLAKVLYKAKKQTWMLSTIKDLLKILPFSKNVGYKISLSGRINSSDKSRLIYITRKNVPLQVFDKNMNYAYSQAKTRIGVFGIKMWIYF